MRNLIHSSRVRGAPLCAALGTGHRAGEDCASRGSSNSMTPDLSSQSSSPLVQASGLSVCLKHMPGASSPPPALRLRPREHPAWVPVSQACCAACQGWAPCPPSKAALGRSPHSSSSLGCVLFASMPPSCLWAPKGRDQPPPQTQPPLLGWCLHILGSRSSLRLRWEGWKLRERMPRAATWSWGWQASPRQLVLFPGARGLPHLLPDTKGLPHCFRNPPRLLGACRPRLASCPV